MDNKVFIGSLSWDATEDQLKEHFAQAGEITSVFIPKDKFSGKSKGFGFVEYATAEEAQKAIELFNGQEFLGRPLVVNIARPKEDRPRNFDRNNRGGSYNRGGYDR
ncbi:MAG TPA: RNA-binding protein [bacterium]|nr:RNA-binding protein [bacterium]